MFFFFYYSAAIQAIAAYLDAFQKIADAATNSRGKFKQIGNRNKKKKKKIKIKLLQIKNLKSFFQIFFTIFYIYFFLLSFYYFFFCVFKLFFYYLL